MKFLLENEITDHSKEILSTERIAKNYLRISTSYENVDSDFNGSYGITLDPNQISDLIGVLLHFQSKMRK